MFGFDVWAIVASVGAMLAAFAGVAWKSYRAGRDRERVENAEDDAQMQLEFDKIDRDAPDLDGSIDRLRKRAKNGRSSGSK
jgi:Flp pilus assembly protein TadB